MSSYSLALLNVVAADRYDLGDGAACLGQGDDAGAAAAAQLLGVPGAGQIILRQGVEDLTTLACA